MILETYGITVVPTASVDHALKLVPQWQPQIVITELFLPEKDGYHLVRKLKAFERRGFWPISCIALTTQTSEDDYRKTKITGFDKHIAKPYSIDELISAIADLAKIELSNLKNVYAVKE